MKLTNQAFAAAFAFAAIFTTSAAAKCGPQKSANAALLARMQPLMMKVQPKRAVNPDDAAAPAAEPSITGLWSIQVTAEGQLVDAGFDMWMSDGTEILNDFTAPAAGAVCIGTWTKTAPFTYSLKHPTYIFDESNVNLIGVGIIRETITLDRTGNSYTGTTTFDLYDLLGNPLDHEVSQVAGLRVVVPDDRTQTVGIPGLPVFSTGIQN
jgi:hypothetical protein